MDSSDSDSDYDLVEEEEVVDFEEPPADEMEYDPELFVESQQAAANDASAETGGPWQKVVWQLKHLPYYSAVESEADGHLAAIKGGIARAIMLKDIRPGLLHWVCELDKYIYLHSRRFTRTDHVLLVRLLFQVMTVKDLEFRMVKTMALTVVNLLQKRELLSRADLVLPWRPLYDLYYLVCFKNLEEDGLMLLPENIKVSLEHVIIQCRRFFPDEATAEILAEVRPLLCPWDTMFQRGISLLQLFLPTTLTRQQHQQYGAALWFDEMWFWYSALPNSPPGTSLLAHLFSRLALECPFYIDWTPYWDTLFTFIIRSFQLIVGTGNDRTVVCDATARISADAASNLIVYSLTSDPNDSVLPHLQRLFDATLSYYHPSNLVGNYVAHLLGFQLRLGYALCQRLNRERHRKPCPSLPQVPADKRISDEKVNQVVSLMLPICLQAMFTKSRPEVVTAVVRYLGQLAPKIVIPAVLDKLYPALETVTEPHRLYASLNCLMAVLMPLMRDKQQVIPAKPSSRLLSSTEGAGRCSSNESVAVGGHSNSPVRHDSTDKPSGGGRRRRKSGSATAASESTQPGARMHVLPLLRALLPALDPNDIQKTAMSFQVVSLFCALVPLVDCSDAVHQRNDLTAEEVELCSATAQTEDLAEGILERMFDLVVHNAGVTNSGPKASNPPGVIRGSSEEVLIKSGVYTVCRAMLSNCSTHIHQLLSGRILQFVRENTFTSPIAAASVSDMVHAVVRTNPHGEFPRFLDHILKKLESTITEDQYGEEEVDASIIWLLTITSQLFRIPGSVLSEHRDKILQLLALIRPFRSKQAYEIVQQVVEHLLAALCTCFVHQHDWNRAKLDRPLSQYLPIRHWASVIERKTYKLNWYEPGAEQVAMANEVLRCFLFDQLDILAKPAQLDKTRIRRSLAYVTSCVTGAAYLMPVFSGDVLPLADSAVDLCPFSYIISAAGVPLLSAPDGGPIRERILSVLRSLSAHLMANSEDDTRSLKAICSLYSLLLFHKGLQRGKFNQQIKSFQLSKKLVADHIKGAKGNLEGITNELVTINHHKRLLVRSGYYFTQRHLDIIQDLVSLSTSHYADVRRDAQSALEQCFSVFPYSYRYVMDRLLALLKPDAGITHEQFKGALYIMINGKKQCLCLRQTWQTIRQIWPALVLAQHSEKPSIITLLEVTQNTIVDNLESFQIELRLDSEPLRSLAAQMWTKEPVDGPMVGVRPRWQLPVEAELSAADRRLDEVNADRKRCYHELTQELIKLSNDKTLHWRHTDFAQSLLSLLIRADTEYSPEATLKFTRLLLDDTASTRKMAISLMGAWFKATRPPTVKIEHPGLSATALRASAVAHPVPWGVRRGDNDSLIFDHTNVPDSADQYDHMIFIDKTHVSIECWPDRMLVPAPVAQQVGRNRDQSALTATEALVMQVLADDAFVQKFGTLMAVEEKKGSDKFCPLNYNFFKGLFRSFNSLCLEPYRRLIERMADKPDEGAQRLCAEMVAGLLQGSKQWQFAKLSAMYAWLVPVMRKCIENITTESANNWGSCLATIFDSRDPRRLYPIIELLFELCSVPCDTSFQMATRLFLLQGAVNQGEWRMMTQWHRMGRLIQPMLKQHYQNLRERLGSCLSTMVWFDCPGMHNDFNRQQVDVSQSGVQFDMFGDATSTSPSAMEVDGDSPTTPGAAVGQLSKATPSFELIINGIIDQLGVLYDEMRSGVLAVQQSSSSQMSACASTSNLQNGLTAPPSATKLQQAIDKAAGTLPTNGSRNQLAVAATPIAVDSEQRREAILLLKTALCFLQSHWLNSYEALPVCLMRLFPLLCYFENETSDDELKTDAHYNLKAGMAKCTMRPAAVPHMIDAIEKVCTEEQPVWWKMRVSVCKFLQISIFSNYFTYYPHSGRIARVLDRLIRDERLEVREAAAVTLSGLIQCAYFTVDKALLATYRGWSRDANFVVRHAGVLALAAIVAAYPYTVPKFMPDVLMQLCPHGGEKQPISTTVKKTLSEFKRTHQDSWHEHKEAFTEDQIVELTNLLVSPNYYV